MPSVDIVTTDAGGKWVCDVARTPTAREIGLQAYPYLAPEQGLVFEWPGEPGQTRGFHQGSVPYAIRIVWVLSGVIHHVVDSHPGARSTYSARADWVVEVPLHSPLVQSLYEGGAIFRQSADDHSPKIAQEREQDKIPTLVQQVKDVLTPELLKPEWRKYHEQGDCDPMTGHCYLATEALHHLLKTIGVKTKPMFIKHEDGPHWFLQTEDGRVIDATVSQFDTPVPYHLAKGKGFLTKNPSARAQEVMRRVLQKRLALRRTAATFDPPTITDMDQLIATLAAQLAQNPHLLRWVPDPENRGSTQHVVVTRPFIRQLCRVAGVEDELEIDVITRAVMRPDTLQAFADALVGLGIATLVKAPATGVGIVLYKF